MNVNFETRVVGIEHRTSSKGNPYSIIAFMDGVNTVRAMVDAKCDINGLKPYEPVSLDLEITFGKYGDVRLTAWRTAQ